MYHLKTIHKILRAPHSPHNSTSRFCHFNNILCRHRLWSFSLCSVPHPTHCFFSNKFLSILLRNIYNECASRNMTSQVLQPYKTNYEINFLVDYSLRF